MKRLLPVLMGFVFLLLSSTEGWSLPPCPGYYNTTTWTDCFGTYNFPSGNKYVGEWKDGKRNGQGTYYYLADNKFKGDKYVGEFRDGKYYGQGTLTYAGGHKYVGEFKDSRFNGQGIFYYGVGVSWHRGIYGSPICLPSLFHLPRSTCLVR